MQLYTPFGNIFMGRHWATPPVYLGYIFSITCCTTVWQTNHVFTWSNILSPPTSKIRARSITGTLTMHTTSVLCSTVGSAKRLCAAMSWPYRERLRKWVLSFRRLDTEVRTKWPGTAVVALRLTPSLNPASIRFFQCVKSVSRRLITIAIVTSRLALRIALRNSSGVAKW